MADPRRLTASRGMPYSMRTSPSAPPAALGFCPSSPVRISPRVAWRRVPAVSFQEWRIGRTFLGPCSPGMGRRISTRPASGRWPSFWFIRRFASVRRRPVRRPRVSELLAGTEKRLRRRRPPVLSIGPCCGGSSTRFWTASCQGWPLVWCVTLGRERRSP